MRAAIVASFESPPHYGEQPEPRPARPRELVVDVLAAGLHPRVRSQAGGSHYTSTGELPFVPGIDGVVRDASGRLLYTVLDDTTLGTMAERTIIETDRSIVLPNNIDPVQIAAAMNPAMSSWMALQRRIDFQPGQRVLIVGATGSAGRLAIQVAKTLGAAEVIAAGRNPELLSELPALGADRTCLLSEINQAANVDVVLDYLWGPPAAEAIPTIIGARTDRSSPLAWVQIGSIAGPDSAIPSAALRSSRVCIVGSGIGSVPGREFIEELPALVSAITAGSFDIRATAIPLADVEQAWLSRPDQNERVVLVP